MKLAKIKSSNIIGYFLPDIFEGSIDSIIKEFKILKNKFPKYTNLKIHYNCRDEV